MATETPEKELLSSLVADIKHYHGTDPLRPWLRGIRKLKESLPPPVVREKLPRFLQKCVETFESDSRYRDDSRYVRVWIELMDYVENAKPVLKRMEKNGIGTKRAAFYMAYALYYEKHRRLTDAEKMYHAGVQKLAEPVVDLQNAYEQFIQRVELYKKRKANAILPKKGQPASASSHQISRTTDESNHLRKSRGADTENMSRCVGDETVVVRFVDSAIFGKSEAEDACHHGLIDPTVNMKEAMFAINSMFSEPLEPEPAARRRTRNRQAKNPPLSAELEIFIDKDEKKPVNPCKSNNAVESQKPSDEGFMILADEDKEEDDSDRVGFVSLPVHGELKMEKAGGNGFEVDTACNKNTTTAPFSILADEDVDEGSNHHAQSTKAEAKFRCNSDLFEPTVITREAMADINDMFGKPLDF